MMATEERKRVPLPSEEPEFALRCDKCGCRHFKVINVYSWSDIGRVRRRQCRHCGKVTKTVETICK